MDLLQRIEARRKAKERAWPVGAGALAGYEDVHGHDQTRFSPEEYGDYIATSNDIYSAAQLRARLLSSLRLEAYRGRGTDKLAMPDHPSGRLLRYVNPFWTGHRLARMDELSMSLWGMSYWAVEKDRKVPKELWWLKPSRVKPVPHESGYLKEFLYESVTGQVIPFRPDEIVWFRYPNPIEEFSALSPLAAARLAADSSTAMMQSNRNLFKQGLQLGGLITPPEDKVSFTQDQATDLERLMQRRFTGSDRAHRWAVLRFEAQFKALNITPKDAEFAVGMNMTLRQVCNAYGIPSPLLNDLEHATLANVRELMRGFWENTLVPDAEFKAADIEEQYLPMWRGTRPDHVAYDFTQVPSLQESASEAWGRDRQAIEVGLLTINEVRKSKGLPAVAWGDVYWAPVNKSAVTDNNSKPQGDTAAAPDMSATDEEARALLSALNGRDWSLR